MLSVWTKHLEAAEDQINFTKTLKASKAVTDRLKDIINELEQQVLMSELTMTTYDSADWANKQAHKNGMRAAYRQLFTILSSLDQKD